MRARGRTWAHARKHAHMHSEKHEQQVGPEVLRHFEKAIMLQSLDSHWKEHLAAMDHLRQGIHLRSYAQKNPKQEYKREAFELFADMLEALKLEVVTILSKVRVRAEEDVEAVEAKRREQAAMQAQRQQLQHEGASTSGSDSPAASGQAAMPKVGRNDPCPCGSGKKFKQCHGKI